MEIPIWRNGKPGQPIQWDDIRSVCCLDVDDCEEPDTLRVLLQPSPVAHWTSRSGKGFHAIYEQNSDSPFFADELAALAALWLYDRTSASFELLRRTFQPEQWDDCTQHANTDILKKFLGTRVLNDDDVADWLAEHNYTIGERYPHERCPVNSDRPGNRFPVVVNDAGIYCHICASSGRGFWSWEWLLGKRVPSVVGYLVKHKTHYEHARHILAQTFPRLSSRVMERVYAAALVAEHGEDARTMPIFFPRRNFLRVGNWWATETGENYNNDVKAILSGLPACQYVDKKSKKLKADPSIVAKLAQTIDLTENGYPPLSVIRGLRIFGHHLQYTNNQYTIVLQNNTLKNSPDVQPKYIPERKRMTRDEAWTILEQPFPGINRYAIELLIAARGTSEGRIGLPSFLYISGPSGAAKTSSVLIAAAICGDSNSSIVWTNSTERVREGMISAKQRGDFVTFNEILKCAKKERVEFQIAMDEILNLTPDSTSHMLYVGHVPLGRLPVCVWTDTEVPTEIRESVQLGRRLIHVHLSRKMEWEQPIADHGIVEIERLRLAGKQYADACDAIVSHVIDAYFNAPHDLKTIGELLGFRTLEKSNESVGANLMLELFRAVCDAPELTGPLRLRYGPNWKVIDLAGRGPLIDLWEAVRDAENPKLSRKCSEANWPSILSVDCPVEFDCQSNGNKVVVRFVSRSPLGTKFNHEITA